MQGRPYIQCRSVVSTGASALVCWPKGLAGAILRSYAVERVGFKIL